MPIPFNEATYNQTDSINSLVLAQQNESTALDRTDVRELPRGAKAAAAAHAVNGTLWDRTMQTLPATRDPDNATSSLQTCSGAHCAAHLVGHSSENNGNLLFEAARASMRASQPHKLQTSSEVPRHMDSFTVTY